MTTTDQRSPAEVIAERLAHLPRDERRAAVRAMQKHRRRWRGFWARPNQIEPPGDCWQTWALVGGRGAGKTRTGAEFVIDRCQQYHRAKTRHRGALVGRTAADVRDTMVEGESGLMECLDRRGIPAKYEPGRRRIMVPSLNAELHTYSAMEPESLRGPQHHTAWADEPAAWRHLVDKQGNTAWTNLMFGLRLDAAGLVPRVCATTTPKPIDLVKEWFAATTPCPRPAGHQGDHGPRMDDDPPAAGNPCGYMDPSVVMTTGSLYSNISYLAPAFVTQIVERYRNSPLGASEIFGRLVLDVDGALWTIDRINSGRVLRAPEVTQVIVAVDPPGKWNAECGIVVLGIEAHPVQPGRPHVYVLDDMSMSGRAEEWGARVILAYYRHNASLVVAEDNQGGDMVRATIQLQDPAVAYESVSAKRSKWERAEPVASAYDRVHHVGTFGLLESQMTTWTEDDPYSPDRMDALVHGVRHLMPALTTAPMVSLSPADYPMPAPSGFQLGTRY